MKGGVTKEWQPLYYNLCTLNLKCTDFSPEFGYFYAKLSRMVRVRPVRAMSRSHYNINEYAFERPIYMYVQRQPCFYLFGINVSDIEFEVVSYNVNGIGDDRKRRKNFNFLKKQTSNKAVIFMQEIHSTKATEKRFEYRWGGKMLSSHGTSISTGVCICFRYNLEHKIIKVISDDEGRYIIANMEIQGNPCVLVNCYALNTETGQIKTFQDLANRLSDLDADPECNYIFGGDWNLIFDTTVESIEGGGG